MIRSNMYVRVSLPQQKVHRHVRIRQSALSAVNVFLSGWPMRIVVLEVHTTPLGAEEGKDDMCMEIAFGVERGEKWTL